MTGSSAGEMEEEAQSQVNSQDNIAEKAAEDVCFPMEQERSCDSQGIDFQVMEEFAKEMRSLLRGMDDEYRLAQESRVYLPVRKHRTGSRVSTIDEKHEVATALHHHPAFNPPPVRNAPSMARNSLDEERFSARRLNLPKMAKSGTAGTATSTCPATPIPASRASPPLDRFAFFNPGMEETIQAQEFCDLVSPGQSYADLFSPENGTWWLDTLNPTVEEMRMLSKAFNIHPLTNEDIRTQESREKVELFRTYYFVCFRSFESDPESEEYLEAANMYIVVFRGGLLTFRFTNTPHAQNVRRRIRQLRDYVSVSSDWICYALIDDITDAFAPLVTAVERETEAVEDAVTVARVDETGETLTRISLLRKKIMGLMKLLGGKADVIKMFAKRCNENWAVAPTGEIGLYLGDIQGTPPHLTWLT
jgi:magnesium transporter